MISPTLKKTLLIPVIPDNDKIQAIRVRRSLYAFIGAGIHTLMCMILWVDGLFRTTLWEFIGVFSVIWIGYFVNFLIIRLGINKRFKDPRLTFPMMLWAVSCLMYTIALTNSLRSVLLMFYLLILAVGAFYLNRFRYVWMVLYGIVWYLAIIIYFINYYPDLINLKTEMAVFFCYVGISFSLSVVCAKMNNLRKELKRKNRSLSAALKYIKSISVTDELTGLKNRRYIYNILSQQRLMAERKQYGFSICMIDLDYFKNINDLYGHLLGDKMLKSFAATVAKKLRKIDYFARIGGEEFLLILPLTDKIQAERMAGRLRETIENENFNNIVPGAKLTVSIGVTDYRWPEMIEETLSRADGALYSAKRAGRNQVKVD